jgi:ABC-type dipeptide/oligopeptide/nickel transport system ATPase component
MRVMIAMGFAAIELLIADEPTTVDVRSKQMSS